VNTKKYFLGFPPNKCSKFLLLSLKSSIAEKRHGLFKSYSEKKRRKEKKRLSKNGNKSVRDIENNGYLDGCLKKKDE